MKIAFDHQIFTMQPYGGISRYYSILGRILVELKQDVNIFSAFYQNNYLDELSADIVRGKKVEKYPPKMNRLFMWLNGLLFKKNMRHWNPDIIHETYYHSVVLKNKSCPVVVTVYDMIHELFPESFSSKDETSRYKKLSVDRADHVICISQSTKSDLVRLFGIAENKVSVVYLGVEKKSTDHKTYCSPSVSHRPYLLYVGNRQGYK
ncbi:glycosyltransferase, partial [Marinobacterium sedimentorum]|uniref:glycosyltransferase n=1 Tax=Marinobacterium sedimentorum TaxID=2927804 RepID=UPI0020C60176